MFDSLCEPGTQVEPNIRISGSMNGADIRCKPLHTALNMACKFDIGFMHANKHQSALAREVFLRKLTFDFLLGSVPWSF